MPRIGVFVCHCGSNIAATVDVAEVARFAGTLADVAYSTTHKYTCSDPGQEEIRKAIHEHDLDRIVAIYNASIPSRSATASLDQGLHTARCDQCLTCDQGITVGGMPDPEVAHRIQTIGKGGGEFRRHPARRGGGGDRPFGQRQKFADVGAVGSGTSHIRPADRCGQGLYCLERGRARPRPPWPYRNCAASLPPAPDHERGRAGGGLRRRVRRRPSPRRR